MSNYPYRIIDFIDDTNCYSVVWTGKDQVEHNALVPALKDANGNVNRTQSLRAIEQHIKSVENKEKTIPDGQTLVGTTGTAVDNNDDAQDAVEQPPENAEEL